jgi:twitching motility protein PilJ
MVMVTRSKPATTSSGFWFNDLKAFPKLILGLSSVGATMIIVAVIGLIGLTAMKGKMQSSYEESTSALSHIGGISTSLGLYHSALLNTGRHTRKRDFDDAVAPLAELKRQVLAPLDAYKTVEIQAASLDERQGKHTAPTLQKALKEYFAASEGAIGAFADSFNASLSEEQRQAMRDLGHFSLSVDVANKYGASTIEARGLMNSVRETAKELNDRGQVEADYYVNMIVVGGFIALLLGGGIGYAVVRNMTRSIVHVADVAGQAAAGNLQARARLESRDEIGHMAVAFNAMLDRITTLASTEEERDRMQKRLAQLQVLVSDVGKGDLTKRGEVTADMFGTVADGLNLMIQRFSQLMRHVRESAERVSKSAGVLRENAGQMAGTVRRQADESRKALGVVEQLAVSMRQLSDMAGASSESARQVVQATEEGHIAVQETVEDMGRMRSAVQRMVKQIKLLDDRSLEISQIVSAIRENANQTNLLALNAAIEAAGVGEVSARFGIVVDQVRKLAESSTQATREALDLIKAIQSEAHHAVVAMEQEMQATDAGSASAVRTGDLFRNIATIAQRSAEMAHTIASSVAEQGASTDQVGRSIKDFTGAATATQHVTDQTRATVEDMSKVAESLAASVAQFKLA